MKMNATQALLLSQLDSRREGFTVGELATLVEKGETTVRENLKKLATDGAVVKDGKNYRRPNHATPEVDAEMDAAMREQMAQFPEGEEPEEQPASDVVLGLAAMAAERALATTEEAQTAAEPEAGSTNQPADDEAQMTIGRREKARINPETGKKIYRPRRANPDRPVRTNRKTGSKIQVIPLAEMTVIDAGATMPWYTICLTHDQHVGSMKIMGAWDKSTNPESFCPGCREFLATK